jgi:adenylylsulfate kinase
MLNFNKSYNSHFYQCYKEEKVLWFTGLSGSGKSTLTSLVNKGLFQLGYHSFILDGDKIRNGICKDLGFSEKDRAENVRRVGEIAKLFSESGTLVLAALISPYRTDREKVRSLFSNDDFIEIYCKCPIEICENRDVKGLYESARKGKIKEFTGISSPYEEPINPEIVIDTSILSEEQSVKMILNFLQSKGVITLKKTV